MMTKKVMTLELSRENEFSDGYLYRSLELPAQEYEIRDVLQQLRQRSADITPDQIAIYVTARIPSSSADLISKAHSPRQRTSTTNSLSI